MAASGSVGADCHALPSREVVELGGAGLREGTFADLQGTDADPEANYLSERPCGLSLLPVYWDGTAISLELPWNISFGSTLALFGITKLCYRSINPGLWTPELAGLGFALLASRVIRDVD